MGDSKAYIIVKRRCQRGWSSSLRCPWRSLHCPTRPHYVFLWPHPNRRPGSSGIRAGPLRETTLPIASERPSVVGSLAAMSALGSLAAACEGEIARSNQDTEEVQGDASSTTATGGEDSSSYREKPRTRQNFSWRQVSVLEQVFETDPLPRQVRAHRHTTTAATHGLRTHPRPLPSRRRPCASNSPNGWASPPAVSKSGSKTGGRNGSRNSKRSGTTRPRSRASHPASTPSRSSCPTPRARTHSASSHQATSRPACS